MTVRADAADMTASRAAGDCLISVVIPTFDRPDYLRTALASVLG